MIAGTPTFVDQSGSLKQTVGWDVFNQRILESMNLVKEARELGIRFKDENPTPNANGYLVCHAFDREDNNPSAGIHYETGRYNDFAGEIMSFWDLAATLGLWPDWKEAQRHYGDKYGIPYPLSNGRPKLMTANEAVSEDPKLSGSRSKPKKAGPPKNIKRRNPDAVYDYKDETGKLIFQACRWNYIDEATGEHDKTFGQRQPNEHGGWTPSLKGIDRKPLYNLPDLVYSDESDLVFIPEGEKDVESLLTIDLLAVTNVGGANKWKDYYCDYLMGRNVVLLPDNDKSGRDHATNIAKVLTGVAKSIKVIELPGLPDKGDVTDWLEAGRTAADFLQLVDEADEWEPEAAEESNQLPVISFDEDGGDDYPDPGPLPEHLYEVSGIIGDISRMAVNWHNYTSKPTALAGACAFLSCLVGRVVRSSQQDFPNAYFLSVAPTGTGKESIQNVIKQLLSREYEVPGGWPDGSGNTIVDISPRLIGKVASGEGLEDQLVLQKNLLLVEDECHDLFRDKKNMSTYQRGHVDRMLMFYSQAASSFTMRAKAGKDGKADSPPKVYRPHVTYVGSTTPDSLCDDASNLSFASGLLPRMIPFIDDGKEGRKRNPNVDFKREIPDEISSIIELWLKRDAEAKGEISGSSTGDSVSKWRPMIVQFEQSAEDTVYRLLDDIDERWKPSDGPEYQLRTRQVENLKTLALLSACSRDPGHPTIEFEDVQWAYSITDWGIKKILHMWGQHKHASKHDECCKAVLAIVDGWKRSPGRISQKELGRKAQRAGIEVRDRDSSIRDLIAQERLFCVPAKQSDSYKGSHFENVSVFRQRTPQEQQERTAW